MDGRRWRHTSENPFLRHVHPFDPFKNNHCHRSMRKNNNKKKSRQETLQFVCVCTLHKCQPAFFVSYRIVNVTVRCRRLVTSWETIAKRKKPTVALHFFVSSTISAWACVVVAWVSGIDMKPKSNRIGVSHFSLFGILLSSSFERRKKKTMWNPTSGRVQQNAEIRVSRDCDPCKTFPCIKQEESGDKSSQFQMFTFQLYCCTMLIRFVLLLCLLILLLFSTSSSS